MNEPFALMILPHLQVQNANAISGPLSWGFPAPSAFLGFVHALQRRFSAELTAGLGGVGIICHQFAPQVTSVQRGRIQAFNLTRNPLKKKGEPASFVEEGRAHMEVTLLIAVNDYMPQRSGEFFASEVMHTAHGMRLAGGSLLPMGQGKRFEAAWHPLAEDEEEQAEQFRKMRKRLLPGFALVHREDILAEHIDQMRRKQPEAAALDALLDLSGLNFEPDLPDPDRPGETAWGIRRKPGWLVPLPIGYAALSPLYPAGEVKNARDNDTPFRFVETLYSVGEWVSPHRMTSYNQLIWRYQTDLDKGLYLCVNHFRTNTINTSAEKCKEEEHEGE